MIHGQLKVQNSAYSPRTPCSESGKLNLWLKLRQGPSLRSAKSRNVGISHCQYDRKPLLENQNLMNKLIPVPQRPALSCFSLCKLGEVPVGLLEHRAESGNQTGRYRSEQPCFVVNYLRYKINRGVLSYSQNKKGSCVHVITLRTPMALTV